MNTDRFDAFVHSIAGAASRRAALRSLISGGLAVLLTHLRVADATARKKKKCRGGKKKCGKKCIPKTSCCKSIDCPTGASCVDGLCVCPIGETACGGACVNLETDGTNCGACGIVCDIDDCVHGACTCSGNFDCFTGCTCASRKEGAPNGCTGGLEGEACSVDTDCPLGTICRANDTCSTPCLP